MYGQTLRIAYEDEKSTKEDFSKRSSVSFEGIEQFPLALPPQGFTGPPRDGKWVDSKVSGKGQV